MKRIELKLTGCYPIGKTPCPFARYVGGEWLECVRVADLFTTPEGTFPYFRVSRKDAGIPDWCPLPSVGVWDDKVQSIAEEMICKLNSCEYHGRNGWDTMPEEELDNALEERLVENDYVDAMNYLLFKLLRART